MPREQQPAAIVAPVNVQPAQGDEASARAGQAFPHLVVVGMDADFDQAIGALEQQPARIRMQAGWLEIGVAITDCP